MRTLVPAVLAAALAGALYAPALAIAPPHLLHDEILFALQAKSIADTGRDLNGRFLAVYFQEPTYPAGRDPLCIYVTAGVLTLLPLSEASIRLPSALVGALGVGLMFVLARLLFARDLMAWIVAGIFALTPTYFIHSRFALSVIYPVPFVVLWLVTLFLYLSRGRLGYAAACGAVLGLGVYSYLAAAIMMPLYLAATVVALAVRRDTRAIGAVIAAFAVLMIPLVLWQLTHPDRYANIASAYRFYDAEQMSAGTKLRELISGPSLLLRLDTLWDAFNPSRLFFTGESSIQISTRQVGSFLLPVAVFVAIGIRELARPPRTLLGGLLLFGLASAPLPAVLMADVEIRRWLVVLPFAALIAGYGAARLLRGGRWARTIAVVLLALMPLQFAAFAGDYFGPYRERASVWFGGNLRGALETVLNDAHERPPSVVYISSEIPWVEVYWRFYTTVRGQRALLDRTRYVRLQSGEVPAPVPDAVMVAPANEASAAAVAGAGWVPSHVITEPNGTPSFAVSKAGA